MDQSLERAVSETVSEVKELFEDRGSAWYGGEAVSQLQHALQSALFAERAAAPPALIVAALLHDIGHLLHNLPEDAAEQGIDDHHESRSATWLRERFEAAVAEPVGMHVAAKRYLCAVDLDYFDRLSPASRTSLELQGGPMSADEVEVFEHRPNFDDAIRLRYWDDAAKVVDLETPPLEHFLPYVERAVQAAQS